MGRRGHSGLSKTDKEKVDEAMESEVVRAATAAADSASVAKAMLAKGDVSAAVDDEQDAVSLEKNVEEVASTKYLKAAAKRGSEKARQALESLQNAEEGRRAKSTVAPVVSAAKTATKETEYDALREVAKVHVGHTKKRIENRKRSRSASKARKSKSPNKSPKKLSAWHMHVKAFSKEHEGKYKFSELMKAAAEHWKRIKEENANAMSQQY